MALRKQEAGLSGARNVPCMVRAACVQGTDIGLDESQGWALCMWLHVVGHTAQPRLGECRQTGRPAVTHVKHSEGCRLGHGIVLLHSRSGSRSGSLLAPLLASLALGGALDGLAPAPHSKAHLSPTPASAKLQAQQ